MSNFKTKLLGLSGLAAIFSGLAYGQANCSSTGSVAALTRTESTNDQTGDILIRCTNSGLGPGGAVAAGRINIQVFAGNTGVTFTSKVLDSATGLTEATAIVSNCTTNTVQAYCIANGVGAPLDNNNASGTLTGTNPIRPIPYNPGAAVSGNISGGTLLFVGIPTPALTSSATADFFDVIIRNIRINANGVATPTTGPVTVTYQAVVSGTPVFQSNINSTNQIAIVQPGLNISATGPYKDYGASAAVRGLAVIPANAIPVNTTGSNNFVICQTLTPSQVLTTTATSKDRVGLLFTLFAQEAFPEAFKKQTNEASELLLGPAAAPGPPAVFAYPSGGTTNITAGTTTTNAASSGTRIRLVFTNVPAGITLYTIAPAGGVIPSTNIAALPLGGAQITYTTSETGSFTAGTSVAVADAAGTNFNYIAIPSTGTGTAEAVFEVTADDFNNLAGFLIPVWAQFANGAVTGSATPISVAVSLAPTGVPNQIPNFSGAAAATVSFKASAFNACASDLLFPFVTNSSGFDTGLAIANTTSDPFGTPGQSGSCNLNFYGQNAPTAPVSTGTLKAGATYANIVSGLAANFQGYIIAQCTFQFAHGYAFISYNFGQASATSTSYLATVIPDPNQTGGRNGSPAEGLGQ